MVFGEDFQNLQFDQNLSMSYFKHMSGREAVRIYIISYHDNIYGIPKVIPSIFGWNQLF